MRPWPRRGLSALAFGALLGLRAPSALAGAFDVEGFGPAGVAEVNARAARADDGTATFYNPGGLGLGHGVRVEAAPELGVSALTAQGSVTSLVDPFGVAFAFDATIPFTGALANRIRFGFGGYFLPTSALRMVVRAVEEPQFPYYDNRTQRLVSIPALAVRIFDNLAIGAGANILAGVTGPADVRTGASGATESRIDVEATTVVAANLGVRFDPAPWARLAFAYRQRFAIPSVITTTAEVAGVPLNVDIEARQALYDPDTFVLATSFDVGRASFELDASYAIWSGYDGPFVFVRAELPGVRVSPAEPQPMFRDVIGLRAAGTYRLDVGPHADVTLRLGLGGEPTVLKSAQQGRSNLLDGDKLLAGAGATLGLRDLLPRPVRIGLGLATNVVTSYEQDKRVCRAAPCTPDTVAGPDAARPSAGIDNPGYPTLRGSGTFWAMSLGVGVDL